MRNYDLDFLKRFSLVIAFLAALTLGLILFAAFVVARLLATRTRGLSIRMQVFLALGVIVGAFAFGLGLMVAWGAADLAGSLRHGERILGSLGAALIILLAAAGCGLLPEVKDDTAGWSAQDPGSSGASRRAARP